MKLSRSNRFLLSHKAAAYTLWASAKTSYAIEGIRRPFAAGPSALNMPTAAALVDYWKQRAAQGQAAAHNG